MAIIVGDMHGNVEKVKAWLAYKPEVEHVALGDYLDSFYEPQERQIETLELPLKSDAVLLWGNHELNYVDHAPWLSAGYQYGLEKPYIDRLEANISRFEAAYAVDGWLCTHAGVSEKIVNLVGDNPDLVAVADWLNAKMVKWLHDRANKNVLFDIGKGRVRARHRLTGRVLARTRRRRFRRDHDHARRGCSCLTRRRHSRGARALTWIQPGAGRWRSQEARTRLRAVG